MEEKGQRRLSVLLGVTIAFEGIRAGAGSFRLLLDLPARHQIGAVAFADFSRATDLSTAGIAFYSIYGFGGLLLTLATALVAWRLKAPRAARMLTALSAGCSLLVLVFTTKAAPLMWKVGSSPNDATLLSELLNGFTVWTTLRVACVDTSFVAVVAALVRQAAFVPSSNRASPRVLPVDQSATVFIASNKRSGETNQGP